MKETGSNKIAIVIVIILVLLSLCCCCLIANFYLESEGHFWSNMLGSLSLLPNLG